MSRVQDSARRRDDAGQRRRSSQGTRHFEPVVDHIDADLDFVVPRCRFSSASDTSSRPSHSWVFSLKAATDVLDAGESKTVQGMGDGLQVPLRQMQVLGGHLQITMPEQNLDGAQSVPASNKWAAQLWWRTWIAWASLRSPPPDLGPSNTVECCLTEEKRNVGL